MRLFCAINSDTTTRIEHRINTKENKKGQRQKNKDQIRKTIDNRRIDNRRVHIKLRAMLEW